jgi:pyridoxamine 5'-phosphate oxidase
MSDTAPIEHPTRLTVGDFTASDDPLPLFAQWLDEATQSEPADANAMALATVDQTGLPNVRMVLLKGFDERGLVFFSHHTSRKGRELNANPQAALLFHWSPLGRQVRVEGRVDHVSEEESDAYFVTRPRDAQLGALASRQSEPLESRALLDERIVELKSDLGDGPVPRPPTWGGFRLVPEAW